MGNQQAAAQQFTHRAGQVRRRRRIAQVVVAEPGEPADQPRQRRRRAQEAARRGHALHAGIQQDRAELDDLGRRVVGKTRGLQVHHGQGAVRIHQARQCGPVEPQLVG
ncbi:MAG: hypothetical protein JRF70_03510 [Deltaproteobacteria bacterium]|nr:hypothetical protein [Deltaproteobacteria bacterium]